MSDEDEVQQACNCMGCFHFTATHEGGATEPKHTHTQKRRVGQPGGVWQYE